MQDLSTVFEKGPNHNAVHTIDVSCRPTGMRRALGMSRISQKLLDTLRGCGLETPRTYKFVLLKILQCSTISTVV